MTSLRKYPNRRLYDLEVSNYVKVTDAAVRARLLKGEKVTAWGGKRSGDDITAEVLASLLVEEVALKRITATQLQQFLHSILGSSDAQPKREIRARSPPGLV